MSSTNPYSVDYVADKPKITDNSEEVGLHNKMTKSSIVRCYPTTVRSLKLFAEQEMQKALNVTHEIKPGHVDPDFILELTKDLHRLGEQRVSEYITRNKTILLSDYAVKIKQKDIYRMKDLADGLEEIIQREEKKLEKDAINFNEFIKKTNAMTIESIECALCETKLRLKKTDEVKEKNAAIFLLRSNIAHLERLLTEYLLCAKFLRAAAIENRGPIDQESGESKKVISKEDIPEISQFTSDVIQYQAENMEASNVPFQDACDLLKTIGRFRDQNLTIITNSHFLRNSLKEAQTAFTSINNKMQAEINEYEKKISDLKIDILTNQKTAKNIKRLLNIFKSSTLAEEKQFEDTLTPCVADTYEICTGIKGGQISLTMMVAAVESHVLSLLFDIEKLPEKLLIKVYRKKQNEKKVEKRKQEEVRRAIAQEERIKITDMRRFDSAKTKLSRRLKYQPQKEKEVVIKTEKTKEAVENEQEEYNFLYG